MIHIKKQDLLGIKEIILYHNNVTRINLTGTTIDLSKLEHLSKLLPSLNGISIKFKCIFFYFQFHIEIVSVYNETKEIVLDHFTSLQSLELKLKSIERYSFGKFDSLRCLYLTFESKIKSEMLSFLIDQCPNITNLFLDCKKLCYFNLDSLNNLKYIWIEGHIYNKDDFNKDLFKTICNSLSDLTIKLENVDDELITKLLCGHIFQNLLKLSIYCTEITKIEKKLFDGFPVLESLYLSYNKELETIDSCAFSSLNKLKELKLYNNNLTSLNPESLTGLSNLIELNLSNNNLTHLEPQVFKDLANLKHLDLHYNKLRHFELSIMEYIDKINRINLSNNPIENKKEILNHYNEKKFSF